MALDQVSTGDPHVAAHNAEREVINQLADGMTKKISSPPGLATGNTLRWDGTKWVASTTRYYEGVGQPNGTVAATIGSRYIDTAATNGAVEWVKRSGGDTNQGWLCVVGDIQKSIVANIDKGNGTINSAVVSRIGSVVDMHLDITMPSNKTATWTLFAALPGFSPGFNRYASLQDNSEQANTLGSVVTTAGGVILYGIVGGKRDRYSGTWLTRDAWPTT